MLIQDDGGSGSGDPEQIVKSRVGVGVDEVREEGKWGRGRRQERGLLPDGLFHHHPTSMETLSRWSLKRRGRERRVYQHPLTHPSSFFLSTIPPSISHQSYLRIPNPPTQHPSPHHRPQPNQPTMSPPTTTTTTTSSVPSDKLTIGILLLGAGVQLRDGMGRCGRVVGSRTGWI